MRECQSKDQWYIRNRDRILEERREERKKKGVGYRFSDKPSKSLTKEQQKELKVGGTFGDFTILSLSYYGKNNKKIPGTYQCKCGRERPFYNHRMPVQCIYCLNFKHGMNRTKEYQAWNRMKMACSNPESPNYLGGHISYPKEWNDFKGFFEDVGLAPSPTCRLRRIDKERDYEIGNVEWRDLKADQEFRRKTRKKRS